MSDDRRLKMPVSPARAAAFDILLRVERTDAYASELLHSPQYSGLSRADHGLATEIVMGVLRWQSALDRAIAGQSSQPIARLDPEVLIALRIGVYQLRFLSRVPQRAAVHESVELIRRARKRSAVSFGNAVLRKLAREEGGSPSRENEDPASVAEAFAHPRWLFERWARVYGLEAARRICSYDQQISKTAVHLSALEVERQLEEEGVRLAAGELLSAARIVESGDITQTAAFRSGQVAIQDEASQLVALLAGSGESILDCCAAPGSKTRILAQRNPTATVIAVELHPHRAKLLRRLVPAENVEVVREDIRNYISGRDFDRVLADVPCSGTGTLARNPEIKWRLQENDLARLAALQLSILRSAMKQVGSGGRLVYSTCSLEEEEGGAVVEKALAEDPSFSRVDCRVELERLRNDGQLVLADFASLVRGKDLRTLPGVHPCDGFFAAILQRA